MRPVTVMITVSTVDWLPLGLQYPEEIPHAVPV